MVTTVVKCWRCKKKWEIWIIPNLSKKLQHAQCPYCKAWNRRQIEEFYENMEG